MATVPVAQIGQGVQAQPTTFQSPNVPAAAFGTEGQQLSQAGQQLSQVGNLLTQRTIEFQIEDNEREAKRLDVEMSNAIRSQMFGDKDNPGFYSLKGENAVSAHEQAIKNLEKSRSEILANTKNPAVQRMFNEVSERRIQRELDKMAVKVATERVTAANDVATARKGEALDDASANFNDETVIRSSIGTVRAETADQAIREGWSKERLKSELEQGESAIHAAVLEAKLADNPFLADQYFKENKDRIDGRLHTDIRKKLEAGSVRQQSQLSFDKIIIETQDEKTALATARQIKDPKVRDETSRRLRQFFQDKDRIERRQEREHFDNLSEDAARGVQPKEEDLVGMSERKRKYVKGVFANWQSEQVDPDFERVGDGGRTYEAFRDVQRDPVKLGNMSLEELKSQFELGVKKSTWEKTILPAWVNAGVALNKAQAKDLKRRDPTKFIGLTWTARKDQALRSIDIEDNEEKSDAFLEEFDVRFNELPENQRTMQGRQELLDTMVLEAKNPSLVTDVGVFSDTKTVPFIMTVSEKEDFADDLNFPEEEKEDFIRELDNIRAYLRSVGKPTSRFNIRFVWNARQGRSPGARSQR